MNRLEVLERIAARDCGRVYLAVYDDARLDTFDAVARAAGLRPLGSGWDEAGRSRATANLAHVLHRDLAYGGQLLPRDTAAALAHAFITHFSSDAARYATNTPDALGSTSWCFDSATDATLDTGVVILNADSAAACWFADEDASPGWSLAQ